MGTLSNLQQNSSSNIPIETDQEIIWIYDCQNMSMQSEGLLRSTWIFSRSPGHFPDHPGTRFPDHKDTLQIIQTLWRSSWYFLDHPVTLQIIRTLFILYGLFRLCGCFPDHPDTLQINRILFRSFLSSEHFSDHPDAFQIIGTLFISSGHFSGYPDTFQIIETLCRSSRLFSD